MKKTNKKVLAVTTALASILSAKASARMNPNLKTGLAIGGSALGSLFLINEGLGVFGPATEWYNGKLSLYHNIFGKKEKKPDEQEPDKENKELKEIGSELTEEEQKLGLEIFLKKFNSIATWRGEDLVDFYTDDARFQNLKKALEVIF